MVFVKHFNCRGGNHGEKMIGSAIFGDGKLTIRLPNTKDVVEKGITEDGFGVVTKTVEPRKSPYTMINIQYDVNDLPPQLRGQTYKFKIAAEQISENEFLFPFDRAKMLNKK
jgi:hypothetical protein